MAGASSAAVVQQTERQQVEGAVAHLAPLFLEGRQGPLFAMYYEPAGLPCRRNIVVAQSFGEELNRCRAMIAMQARMLASQGIGTLVLDAYGTGDSGGEFRDHTWDGWRADVLTAIAWLRSRPGGCDTLWGVRVGAMLASQMALDTDGIHNVLLWQPVLSGKVFFNQMLRIRVAADLADPNGIKKTDDLRKVLAAGDCIEVAGYEVTPALATGVEAAAMPAAEAVSARRVAWFEVVAQESQPVGRVNQQYIEALQSAGGKLHTETLVGELFWQVHERAVAPALLDATQKAVASWS